jgi:hypothetical protein
MLKANVSKRLSKKISLGEVSKNTITMIKPWVVFKKDDLNERNTNNSLLYKDVPNKLNKQTFKMAEMTDSLKIVEKIKFYFSLLNHLRKSRIILEVLKHSIKFRKLQIIFKVMFKKLQVILPDNLIRTMKLSKLVRRECLKNNKYFLSQNLFYVARVFFI